LAWVFFAFGLEDFKNGQLQDISDLLNRLTFDLGFQILHRLFGIAFVEQDESISLC
jgi:hypothetical protein